VTVRPRFLTHRWDDHSCRLARFGLLVTCWLSVWALRTWLFPTGREPQVWWQHIVRAFSWCWAAAFPAGLLGTLALLAPRHGRHRDAGAPCEHLVCFRIVSRGRNASALADTVESVRTAMAVRPLFPYRIEVVTDQPVVLPWGDDLRAYVVPADYVTPNRSLYKARALHFVTEVSDLPDQAWVFHCDEESWVTTGLVGGIRDAVVQEEGRVWFGERPRIGQGCILYYRNLAKHPVLTLADSLRTGDDMTRFFLQFRLGKTFSGMHGSFILVRSDVEREVSFDVGPEGSITEDAWWAFQQRYAGRRFRWVDGYLVEQSPEHWMDFAKQRRRWYSGLWKVCLYAPATFVSRLTMMAFLVAWLVSAVGGAYTVVNLLTGFVTPWIPAQLGGFVLSWYLTCYLTGLWLNLRSMPVAERPSPARQALLYAAQVVLLPVFGALEAFGVFLAVARPERGFHVVKKSGSAGEGEADDGLAAAGRDPVAA
jgi:egghead protein (zeste-white 4 protein)